MRIGYACKLIGIKGDFNFKTVKLKTILNIENYVKRVDKIKEILNYNVNALNNQVEEVLKWPKNLWMIRIGSDFFPLYTHPIAEKIYEENSIKSVLATISNIGDKIKNNNIRISMHPGQFTMLVSKKRSTIENSIKDLEYHAEVFRLLGIDYKDQKNEINIHVGAKIKDYKEIFEENFKKLSYDLKSWLSIENDEFSYSIYDIAKISDNVKLILDIHHHWIMFGNFIDINDNIIDVVVNSWRSAIPELHYSLPKEIYVDKNNNFKTNAKTKLRAHSDYCWNDEINRYVYNFSKKFDIMVEAKAKNLASNKLYEYFLKLL